MASTSSVIECYDYSPFKSQLKISDTLLITRKVSKFKSKMPAAISGIDYYNLTKKKQEEKKEKLLQQEERKRKRLEKKTATGGKKTLKKKRR